MRTAGVIVVAAAAALVAAAVATATTAPVSSLPSPSAVASVAPRPDPGDSVRTVQLAGTPDAVVLEAPLDPDVAHLVLFTARPAPGVALVAANCTVEAMSGDGAEPLTRRSASPAEGGDVTISLEGFAPRGSTAVRVRCADIDPAHLVSASLTTIAAPGLG